LVLILIFSAATGPELSFRAGLARQSTRDIEEA
jgi:hypothetical protein